LRRRVEHLRFRFHHSLCALQFNALLVRAGVDPSALDHIDLVDAALCALAAHHFVMNQYKADGDAAGGYIIVPSPARK
jgi:predicted RNase H-like nuclease